MRLMTHGAEGRIEVPIISQPADQVPLLEQAAAGDLQKMIRKLKYFPAPVSAATPATPCPTSGSQSPDRE